MEPEVSLRFGHAGDISVIASLINLAGNGLFEFLLDDLVPHLSAIDFLSYAVSDSDSSFSYSNAILAEKGDEVLGLALCYPGEEFSLPWVARKLIPNKRLEHIQALLDCKLDGTLYLNSLAVAEGVRKMGTGRMLLGCVGELSQYLALDKVTLHVWDKNEAALRIYHEAGFKTNKFVDIMPDKRLPFEGGMLQMEAKVPFVMTD